MAGAEQHISLRGVEADETSWKAAWPARVGLARLTSLLLLALRLTTVVAATWLVARFLQPGGGWELVGAWVVLSALGLVLFELTDRMLRRYLPLAALLHLDVAFPAVAPSRFRTALRAGSTKNLALRQDWLAGSVSDLAPEQAATALLELVGALSVHDGATRGHSERVRAYTELLAEELGMSRQERHQLRWGGLIHDIGKLRVPKAVLNKRSALAADEWEMIRQHPLEGLALAAPLRPWLGDAVLAVSDHHERWEGGGYPSGAAGSDIALSGRIVAVADAFDVMTSARSYKRPVSPRAAREELVACAGTQFDPDVVRAFLAISVPRLRRVLGPLASVQAGVQLLWQYNRFPLGRRLLGAVTITAVTYAGGALHLPDAQARQPQSASPIAGPGLPAGSGTPATVRDPQAGSESLPGSRGGAALLPSANDPVTTPDDVAMPQPDDVDPAAVPPVPAPSTPPGPGSSPLPSPTPTPGFGSGGGLVIDPAQGTVTIVPPGFVPASVPPLIDLPVVGGVACGTLEVCDPIVVPLPPLPLFRLF